MEKKQTSSASSGTKILTLDQVSSGGVAFRRADAGPEIAIVLAKPKLRWQLPKGIVDPGESPEVTVHFYLVEYRSGDVSDHDHEVEEAGWVTIEKAIEFLEFRSERKVVEKAREMIANLISKHD